MSEASKPAGQEGSFWRGPAAKTREYQRYVSRLYLEHGVLKVNLVISTLQIVTLLEGVPVWPEADVKPALDGVGNFVNFNLDE